MSDEWWRWKWLYLRVLPRTFFVEQINDTWDVFRWSNLMNGGQIPGVWWHLNWNGRNGVFYHCDLMGSAGNNIWLTFPISTVKKSWIYQCLTRIVWDSSELSPSGPHGGTRASANVGHHLLAVTCSPPALSNKLPNVLFPYQGRWNPSNLLALRHWGCVFLSGFLASLVKSFDEVRLEKGNVMINYEESGFFSPHCCTDIY